MEAGTKTKRRWGVGQIAGRVLFLIVAFVSLYLLWPSVGEVFDQWRSLKNLKPQWVAVAFGVETLSFVAVWELQRIALQSKRWFPVATSQLAGNAFGRVIPGGVAAAGALQYRMLVRAGLPGARIASSLTAVSALLFGAVLALPLLSLPAIIGGTPVASGLAQAAYLGAAVFVLMLIGGAIVFVWDRPLAAVGRAVERVVNATVRRGRPMAGLEERLLGERNTLRTTFGRRWQAAVLAAAGKSIFDYLALVACLRAVGAEPNPSLILLAYVASAILAMIPLTPGGLGFVEAGLVGMLILAGVGATNAAVATLAYRLVSFWLPIPVGGASYALFRYRYP
ncbi:MAG TPA: lysylphosphatidylglycerol synthase transmembrane domain-containing protein [Gaiellaceae bacterium]|nr:lysylphosphatidylglycerol synthase transmembrane domain-containing protein [Gaiellaceae bacterium]